MALTSFTTEFTSPVSARKLFNAGVLDGHNLGPKLMPQVIVSTEILEGDGGVGTIKQANFTDAMPFKYIKERTDILDKEKLEYKFTLIEGGQLGKKVESASNHITVESTSDGGCVYKVSSEYKALPGIEFTDEEIQFAKNGMTGMFKAVEAYVLANPDAYA
ncbi:hypothetical protein IFM89_038235 [Coptis chinensis]|uniref:Bet v I/Major latex protein domain-containing protein n=1 Tax=Coptis chinensis TaxID=261450 RepID=A0A835HWY8_9MAGN|nr:hypothetical protein IFM89_038235 [Coptis chinensis]